MTIIAAFQTAGVMQVNRQVDETTLSSQMYFPGDEGWEEALAAVGHFVPDEVVGYPTQEDLRAHAFLDKAELLLRMTQAGLITQADAIAAAKGEIPPSFTPIVSQWDETEQFAAQVKWAADQQIGRTNPLIVNVAATLGLPDSLLDEIWGIPEEPTV